MGYEMDLYPLTIVKDRYSGTYSGGLYLAFPLYVEGIPEDVGGGDCEEREFWSDEENSLRVGKGSTADAAEKDLAFKLGLIKEK